MSVFPKKDGVKPFSFKPYIEQTDEERGIYDDIELKFTKSKKLKLGLVCVPSYGHMHPMSQLAKGLVERGHEVHIITNGNEAKEKVDKIYANIEGVTIIYTEGPPLSSLLVNLATNEDGDTGDQAYINAWKPHAIEACKTLAPDMILCDMFSQCGLVAADEMGITGICVLAMPWGFATYYGAFVNPSFSKDTYNCCGCICMFRPILTALVRDLSPMHMKKHPDSAKSFLAGNKRVWICTSFFGFEPAESIPPNAVLTGPFSDPPTDLLPILKEKDEKLYDWLDQAVKDNQDVVYISIGTEAKWRDWSVKAIYEGLKKLGVKVVWSLRDFEIPEPENPNFYVRAWIPQIEVLAHPAMKAGLTHCGMGGTFEFINASQPCITWPHFADQHMNCDLLEKAGVAIVLVNQFRISKEVDETYSYVKEAFTSDNVHDKFKELLQNPKYKKAMVRLNAQRRTTGGVPLACDTVERTYISGVEHLIDKGMEEKTGKWGIFISICSICWFSLIVIALIYFTVQYFMLRDDIEMLAKV